VDGTWTLAGGGQSGQSGQLNGIACLASGVCWAIGYSNDEVLIETDAGS
jgi:hypothetical protein